MAANGKVSQYLDEMFPPLQMGEDVKEGDLVGIRAGTDSIRRWFKAYAGTTGGGNTQCEALGVVLKDMAGGSWDSVWDRIRLIGVDNTTNPGPFYNAVHGQKVYLSDSTPGQATITAPVGAGKLLQEVGRAYCTAKYPKSTDKADAWRVNIRPATTL